MYLFYLAMCTWILNYTLKRLINDVNITLGNENINQIIIEYKIGTSDNDELSKSKRLRSSARPLMIFNQSTLRLENH